MKTSKHEAFCPVKSSNVPVTPTGITDAQSLSAGGNHTCAALGTGAVWCWGGNIHGQLGHGSTDDRSYDPVQVSSLTNALTVSAGWDHTCAALDGSGAACWGFNEFGKLGDGTQTESNVPVTVAGLGSILSISAGGHHTCAVLTDLMARCWGGNGHGQLGNGTETDSASPVAPVGM